MIRIRLGLALFAAFVGFVVYAADAGVCEPCFNAVKAMPLADKACHFVFAGGLTALANGAIGCRALRTGRVSILVGTLVVAVIAAVEEVSQIWVPRRSFDWFDLTANALGIACGDLAARRWRIGVSAPTTGRAGAKTGEMQPESDYPPASAGR